jgi:hypothetical protein
LNFRISPLPYGSAKFRLPTHLMSCQNALRESLKGNAGSQQEAGQDTEGDD